MILCFLRCILPPRSTHRLRCERSRALRQRRFLDPASTVASLPRRGGTPPRSRPHAGVSEALYSSRDRRSSRRCSSRGSLSCGTGKMCDVRNVTIATAVVAASLAACASGSAAGARPTLQLVARVPLGVAGRGFAPSERLLLTATVNGEQVTVPIRATRRGAVVVTFRGLAAMRCQNYRVVARNSIRIRATLVSPPIDCAQL